MKASRRRWSPKSLPRSSSGRAARRPRAAGSGGSLAERGGGAGVACAGGRGGVGRVAAAGEEERGAEGEQDGEGTRQGRVPAPGGCHSEMLLPFDPSTLLRAGSFGPSTRL